MDEHRRPALLKKSAAIRRVRQHQIRKARVASGYKVFLVLLSIGITTVFLIYADSIVGYAITAVVGGGLIALMITD